MRKRPLKKVLDVPSDGVLPALVVLACAFFLGALVGCGLAASVAGGGDDVLATYIRNYLAAAQAGLAQRPELLPLTWEILRWPLFVLLLGFSALGLLGIPILFGVRGFLLSFAAASFVKMFGAAGACLSFLLFGLSGLLTVPVLFVLGVQSLSVSFLWTGSVLKKGKNLPSYGRAYVSRCGVCAGVLAVSILLEHIAVPVLLGMAAQWLFS
jgi:hypothetical protein